MVASARVAYLAFQKALAAHPFKPADGFTPEEGARALVEAAFGVPVDNTLAETILQRTGGNPNFSPGDETPSSSNAYANIATIVAGGTVSSDGCTSDPGAHVGSAWGQIRAVLCEDSSWHHTAAGTSGDWMPMTSESPSWLNTAEVTTSPGGR